MSVWKSVTTVTDLEEFFRLASYGLYEFRAKLIVAFAYDLDALKAAEDEVQRKADSDKSELKAQIAKFGADKVVQPLGTPLVQGEVPKWKKAVPVIKQSQANAEFAYDILERFDLTADFFRTGNLEGNDAGDERIRALLHGIEFRMASDLAEDLDQSASAPILQTGLPGRPTKGKGAIHTEFTRWIERGDPVGTKAGEARKLVAWFIKTHPDSDPPSEKTVGESISSLWRKAKDAAQNQTGNSAQN